MTRVWLTRGGEMTRFWFGGLSARFASSPARTQRYIVEAVVNGQVRQTVATWAMDGELRAQVNVTIEPGDRPGFRVTLCPLLHDTRFL